MPCDEAWPADRIETFRRWVRDGMPALASPYARADALGKNAEFVEGSAQLLRVPVDAKCSGADQFVLSVAAAEEPDAQHPRASCGEQIPYCVPDDVALLGWNPKAIARKRGRDPARVLHARRCLAR